MKLVVKKIEESNLKTMEESFSQTFLEGVNPPYYKQKIFKYFTYKNYFQVEDEDELRVISREHHYNGQYTSTSYTGDYAFLAIANEKIGIDIEIIKERSPEMLNFFSEEEYAYIGSKNRENFFLLWTAEECLIKTSNACFFEDGRNVRIKSFGKKEQKIGDLTFSYEGIMLLNGKDYQVYTGKMDNLIYSISMPVKLN